MAAKKSIADTVRALAEPVAASLGLRLWEIRFVREGGTYFLRVEIDKDEGVMIDDCERMSRAIDPVLDRHDPIDQAYCLEVSSPGLNRELTRPGHFEEMRGRPVLVRLIRPRGGQRDFSGVLLGLRDRTVALRTDGAVLEFDKKELAYVKLDDFD